MALRIYNTLTRRKEEFKPVRKGRVGLYACGPTVYDEPHIGHARSAYVFDCVRNYLAYSGYEVKFVRNITDVDDKIIEKARRRDSGEGAEADLKTAAKNVADKYLARYYEDTDALGIGRADVEPKATQYINKMIRYIADLIKKGYAYVSGGDVYFDVRRFERYGALSGQSLDKMESGARVSPGENKRDPLDFALWKSVKPDEPSWKSPWGDGRPGWHIECSVMSTDILGATFDIHGGGLDLIFPHHENEIAQSCASSGKGFANYWMHNGLLTINGEKMAKSLGNFISIKDVLQRYHPETLKIFFLSGHYRSPIDFTQDRMDEAKRARERFYILFDRMRRAGEPAYCTPCNRDEAEDIEALKKKFTEAMDDDFNTPLALGCLYEMVNAANRSLDRGATEKGLLSYCKNALMELGGIFGLFKDKSAFEERSLVEARVAEAIAERARARKEGDYKKADGIRRALLEEGIILEDTKEGTVWRRSV